MHKINVLLIGPESFLSSLNELRKYLKFDFIVKKPNISINSLEKYDGIIIHEDHISNIRSFLEYKKCFRILATSKKKNAETNFDFILKLPTSITEINNLIESSAAKKIFNKNSSIKIKSYLLDKNERKLFKKDKFIILTEKEIQLLELFLSEKKVISKKNILSLVWQYSSDADTHTVETHVYRLRKKINEKFSDEKFILNNKEGYYL
tara:strand:- start:683 stop:1303 length:621 start_codon:yes stop_codon:yes gene_type:complete